MTVRKIFYTIFGLIDENTEFWIYDNGQHLITHGKWYQDNCIRYLNYEVEFFTMQDDNNVYITIK